MYNWSNKVIARESLQKIYRSYFFFCRWFPVYGIWIDAENYCQSTGGHLISINSYEELKMVTFMCQTTTSNLCLLPIIFIGLSNTISGLKWLDNSPIALNFWEKLNYFPKFNKFTLNSTDREFDINEIVVINSTCSAMITKSLHSVSWNSIHCFESYGIWNYGNSNM